MNAYNDIPLRSARNAIISLLFGMPANTGKDAYPTSPRFIPSVLQDLPIAYRAKVPNGQATVFYVIGAQKNTEYILCDEQGRPLPDNGLEIKGEILDLADDTDTRLFNLRALGIFPAAAALPIPASDDAQAIEAFVHTWRRVAAITTPIVTEDRSFRILARSLQPSGPPEGYLHQIISLRVGIDTALAVGWKPILDTDRLLDDGKALLINYNQPGPLKVGIVRSQEGIRYQLLEETPDGRVARSGIAVGGAQGATGDMDIVLESTGDFKEDAQLVIRAFRDENDRDNKDLLLAADLDSRLTIRVRPNTLTSVKLNTVVVDYDKNATVEVSGIQASVAYQLYGRLLLLQEYAPDGSPEIPDPEKIEELAPIGEPKVGSEGGTLKFNTGKQQEDTVFVLQATKREPANGAILRLSTILVLLVKPYPKVAVSLAKATIAPGEEGHIVLEGTQAGVKYQLTANDKDIGEPGYHLADRAIGSIQARREYGMRIGIDFKIGQEGDTVSSLFETELLVLPTGAVAEETTFKVVAVKSYTGQRKELSKSVTLKLKP